MEHHYSGHKSIISIIEDCNAVISRSMGKNMYEHLKNKEVIITNESNIYNAINLYLN